MPFSHPFDLVPQSDVWVSVWSTLGLLVPVLIAAALLFALYRVVRKAVAGGIRDASGERTRQDLHSRP